MGLDHTRLDSDWNNIHELLADIQNFLSTHPDHELLPADDPGINYSPPRVARVGFSSFRVIPPEVAYENIKKSARGEVVPEWDEQARFWTIPLPKLAETLDTEKNSGLTDMFKTQHGRQALCMSLSFGKKARLHTAELEAKFQTYQHIDKIREMLRVFATELVMRGETHDRSKLESIESKTYAEFTPKLKSSTYGSEEYKGFLRDMKPALDHHYANNRHHPEHHTGGIDGMNLLDVMEMWIDWYCSSMRHANGDMGKSIDINEKRFSMSPQLVAIFRNTLRDLNDGTLSKNRAQPPKT